MMVELWSINRVLRWTGLRLMVEPGSPNGSPTLIGVKWVGLYGSPGWMRWEPWTKPFWRRWQQRAATGASNSGSGRVDPQHTVD